MVDVCMVRGCYDNDDKNIELFRPPSDDEVYRKWCKVIQVATGQLLHSSNFVCEKHFKKENVICGIVLKDNDGRVIIHKQYKQKTLRPGAVPSIFNGKTIILSDTVATFVLPQYVKADGSKTGANNAVKTKQGGHAQPSSKRMKTTTTTTAAGTGTGAGATSGGNYPQYCNVNNQQQGIMLASEDNSNFILPDMNTYNSVEIKSPDMHYPLFDALFNDIYSGSLKIKLPNPSWSASIQTMPHLILFREAGRITNFRQLPHFLKHVTLHPSLKMELFIKDKFVMTETNLKTFEDVQNAINEIGAI